MPNVTIQRPYHAFAEKVHTQRMASHEASEESGSKVRYTH